MGIGGAFEPKDGRGCAERALKAYRERYGDFGPTLAAEKLAGEERIGVSDETLRRWLLAAGLREGKRRRPTCRSPFRAGV
jgi:hypothetical protein